MPSYPFRPPETFLGLPPGPPEQGCRAAILGVPVDKRAIARSMEAASIRPDFEFRDEDSSTKPWHFIKAAGTVTGPGAAIKASDYSKELDWEIELAAVIGGG